MAPSPENRFIRHGRLRVSADRTHLEHVDGTPFFYLADTAWNGPLLSSDGDWQTYLADRVAKGFTAIQFITHAPWSAALTDLEGQTAWTDDPKSPINEAFFDRIDRRIAEINAAGLLAVPVLAWAANFGASARLNVGHTAHADELIPLLRYQLDRFAGHHCLYFLAGDAHYTWWRSRKWKRVARALFTHPSSLTPHPPLVTLHPAGLTWPYAHFKDEPWLDLYAYQSSHSEDPRTLNWLHAGPPATFWKKHPRPTINVEPVYEDILGRHGPFDAAAVRRAAYASLLNAPTAGVAYGAHGLWGWHDRPAEALNHNGLGVGQPWHVAMNLPGSRHMGHLATLMTSINWWTLRPDPTLITKQPTAPHPISAARSDAGDLALIYSPTGQPITLNPNPLRPDFTPTWFNPRTAERTPATASQHTFSPPAREDWLLLLA